jgi:hypothetical protein
MTRLRASAGLSSPTAYVAAMPLAKFVSYIRASTERHCQSSLGGAAEGCSGPLWQFEGCEKSQHLELNPIDQPDLPKTG